jgi:hypothetical protein
MGWMPEDFFCAHEARSACHCDDTYCPFALPALARMRRIDGFSFSASPLGQLHIFRGKETITFDIALEFGQSPEDPILTGSAARR